VNDGHLAGKILRALYQNVHIIKLSYLITVNVFVGGKVIPVLN